MKDWFLNPCKFLETMQTDLIIINKLYRRWCNQVETLLPKTWHKNLSVAPSVCNSDMTLINISVLSVNNQASRWQILRARRHHNDSTKKMPPSEKGKLILTSSLHFQNTPQIGTFPNESTLIYPFNIQINALLKEVLQGFNSIW